MTATWYSEILEWMSVPVLALLAGILVWRKLHHEFPFFFWYLIASGVGSVLRFVVHFGSIRAYFYAYWLSDLVITIFNFLAIYELFVRRLFPWFYRVRLYRYLFPVAASAIILAGWLTALEAPAKNSAFLIESRVLSFVLAATLAFFVGLMLVMGRTWTRHDLGIASGFAFTLGTFLMMTAFWSRSQYYTSNVVRYIGVLGFDLSCLIWLITFWGPKRQTELLHPESLDPAVLREAKNWEHALKDWLVPGKRRP